MTEANSQRLLCLDFLRGLVIILMTLDHVRDSFSNFAMGILIGVNTPTEIFFTRWITHICAPVFVFLAGMSAYLNKSAKNLSSQDLRKFLIKRGLFLLLLQFSVISFLWMIIIPDKNYIFVFDCGVIWAIGASMLFLALMLFFAEKIIFIIGITIILTNNLFDIYNNNNSIIWNIFYDNASLVLPNKIKIDIYYPLYYWFGIISAGYGFCALFYQNANFQKRKNLLLRLSCGFLLSFFILRYFNLYGDNSQFNHDPNFTIALKSFLDVSKYPPSLHFTLITMAIGFTILTYTENRRNKFIEIISKYGSAPLFYYIAHLTAIPILNFLISKILHQTYPIQSNNITITWLLSVILVVLLYPLVLWFTAFKKKHRNKFPLLNYL